MPLKSYIMRKPILLSFFLFLFFSFVIGQGIPFRGVVRDLHGRPVPGVSVVDRKNNRGSSTDTSGGFSIVVARGTVLTVSAVGFADTAVTANTYDEIAIVLLREIPKTLNQVTISNSPQNGSTSLTTDILNQRFAGSTIENFAKGIGATDIPGSGGQRIAPTTYNGSMLPVYHQPIETKGSRYLLSNWSTGVVVNWSDKLVTNPSYRFNYDKVDGELLLTQDYENYIIIDKETVKSFLLNNDNNWDFENVPAIPGENYLLVISKGDKYAVYKSVRAKFMRAEGQVSGLTSVGKNYDEFVDESDYFILDISRNTIKRFDLRKKSIQKLIPAEAAKTEKYFADHKADKPDDDFVRGYIQFMNH